MRRKAAQAAGDDSEESGSLINTDFSFDIDFDEEDDEIQLDEMGDSSEQQMARMDMLLGLTPSALLSDDSRQVLQRLSFPLVTLGRGATSGAEPAVQLLKLFVTGKEMVDDGAAEHKVQIEKGLLDIGKTNLRPTS